MSVTGLCAAGDSPTVARVSYDIYFLKREPDQSWEEAMEAMEDASDGNEVLAYPPNWDEVVSQVRDILGEVSVLENPPAWEIDHSQTGIQVSCFSGEWSITVPYWSNGAKAAVVASHLRAIAQIVHAATGLDAYDPQVNEAVLADSWTVRAAVSVFDEVAERFDARGIRRG
jgi:hypothetical protein